ncbi:hypothetical protein [Arcobacter sp.]|uniref:hypothetical protein n=1 Tax=Arcobacter sp. TaxID=1872629 RepID=UPI003D126F68
MKTLLFSILFTTLVFANYNYSNQNSGKIDMHGGKSDNLLKDKNSLSNMNSNSLGNQLKKKKEPKTEVIEEKEFKELKELGL